MKDKNFFIFGIPVKTDLCEVRFLKYHEYIENLPELSMMSLNVLHIYYQYRKGISPFDEAALRSLEGLKAISLFEIVTMKGHEQFVDAYFKVLKLVIDDIHAIEAIFDSEKLFMEYRQLVMDMNMLTESPVNANPEIQRSLERSMRVKQEHSEKQSYGDIVSAIVAGTSNSFKDSIEMTVLQLYSIYYRLAAIFDYNTSTLFATVAEKVNISSWNKHIDLWQTESHSVDKKEFENKFGNML